MIDVRIAVRAVFGDVGEAVAGVVLELARERRAAAVRSVFVEAVAHRVVLPVLLARLRPAVERFLRVGKAVQFVVSVML